MSEHPPTEISRRLDSLISAQSSHFIMSATNMMKDLPIIVYLSAVLCILSSDLLKSKACSDTKDDQMDIDRLSLTPNRHKRECRPCIQG